MSLMISQDHCNKITRQYQMRLTQFPPDWQAKIQEAMKQYTPDEQICMQFLLAFMPDQDACSYPLAVLEQYLRFSLAIREQVPWGNEIQDDLFLNHVLAYRINNENIDFCLDECSAELLPRIAGKSMADSVLTVNEWCFEHAVYQSTDLRTLSPRAVRTRAYGRCGEESTFCVAALRSVCIPARQVYTPKWAHCDDNHAWVEAYVEGRWCFLGACEPEPVLNAGWFDVPASRGMLLHSKLFSTLHGDAPCSVMTEQSAEINVTALYAATKELCVTVKGPSKECCSSATVCLQVMNFSELYTICRAKTDAAGTVRFTVGQGDCVLVAYDGEGHRAEQLVRATDMTVTLRLSTAEQADAMDLLLTPPPGKTPTKTDLSDESKAAYQAKLDRLQEQRKAYEATFFTKETAKAWATCLPAAVQETVAALLPHAAGNHAEITSFLTAEHDSSIALRVKLLQQLRPKDFVDITCALLLSFVTEASRYADPKQYPDDIFEQYLLNPRIQHEMITDYKPQIRGFFTEEQQTVFRADPHQIQHYLEEHLADSEETRYSIFYAAPIGALRYGRANALSKRMLFVAICRSLGIPAKIDPQDESLWFYQRGAFVPVVSRVGQEEAAFGSLLLTTKTTTIPLVPTKQFSVAWFDGNDYVTLGLWETDIISPQQPLSLSVRTGAYRLLTTNRLDDGSVRFHRYHCQVAPDTVTTCCVEVPSETAATSGVVLPEICFSVKGEEVLLSSLLLDHPMTVFALLGVGGEPTEHLLNELIAAETPLAQSPAGFLFVAEEEKSLSHPTLQAALACLPRHQMLISSNFRELTSLFDVLQTQDQRLPLVAVLNAAGESLYASSGYQVGIASQLAKKIMPSG